jgi:hypothetical protein
MKIRELTMEDIDYVKTRSISRGIFHKLPAQTEWSYALVDGEKTMVVGGIHMINQSTAFCWIDMTEESKSQIILVYRVIKQWMEELVRVHGIIRLQAYTEFNFPEADRVLDHLGFSIESEMRKFVGDYPAKLWVKFF